MDYTVESIGRDFGTVLLDMPAGGDGLHAGLQAARAGWVRVRQLLVLIKIKIFVAVTRVGVL